MYIARLKGIKIHLYIPLYAVQSYNYQYVLTCIYSYTMTL